MDGPCTYSVQGPSEPAHRPGGIKKPGLFWMKLTAHRAGLPGNVNMITGSALLPAYLPTVAGKAGYPSDLPVNQSRFPEWYARHLQLLDIISRGYVDCDMRVGTVTVFIA